MKKFQTNLWKYLKSKEGQKLTLTERISLARFVIEECRNVDKKGLIHRDVKLSNFLMNTHVNASWKTEGDYSEDFCLADFGISVKIGEKYGPAGTPGHDL